MNWVKPCSSVSLITGSSSTFTAPAAGGLVGSELSVELLCSVSLGFAAVTDAGSSRAGSGVTCTAWELGSEGFDLPLAASAGPLGSAQSHSHHAQHHQHTSSTAQFQLCEYLGILSNGHGTYDSWSFNSQPSCCYGSQAKSQTHI